MARDGDTRRFCDVCTKQVHDVSALTEAEARGVLAKEFTKGRVCVRYNTDLDGNIRFAPEPGTVTEASGWRTMLAAAGMSLMMMTGCVDTSPDHVEPDQCVYEIGPWWSFSTARGEGSCPAPEPELVGRLEAKIPDEVEPPPETEMGEIAVEPPPAIEPAVQGEVAPPPVEIEPLLELKGDIAGPPDEAADQPCDGPAPPSGPD